MKIPVWYQDKYGKYHRIPPGLITEFGDGHIGISGHRIVTSPAEVAFIATAATTGPFRYDLSFDRLIYVDPNSPYQSSNP